jgi:hypothetical protein
MKGIFRVMLFNGGSQVKPLNFKNCVYALIMFLRLCGLHFCAAKVCLTLSESAPRARRNN